MNEVQSSSCELRESSWQRQFGMLIQSGVLQDHYCITAQLHKAGGAEVEPVGFVVSSSLTSLR